MTALAHASTQPPAFLPALTALPEAPTSTSAAASPLPRRLSRTSTPLVRFEPFTLESAEVAGAWLEDRRNHQWLDFGGGRQVVSGRALYFMSKSKENFIRSMVDENGRQIGVIGLQHVNSPFRNAMLWGVRPRLRPPARTHAWVEIKSFLQLAFDELDLHSVYAWVAEPNRLSLAALERVGFRVMGRQRCAHVINDTLVDRILLDVMASEFEPFDAARDAQ